MAILARFRANSKSFFSLRKANQEHYDRLSELTEPLVSKPKVEKTRFGRKTVSYASQRLRRELSKRDDNVENCSFGLVDARNPFKLQGIIVGPCGTPFEGGIFFVSIDVPSEYPFKPPKIKFKTKVFHPNVASDGTIGIDILGSGWSPALIIEKLLLSICSFLSDPNHCQDSCNPVCDLYWNNRKLYDKIAREWTLKYAML